MRFPWFIENNMERIGISNKVKHLTDDYPLETHFVWETKKRNTWLGLQNFLDELRIWDNEEDAQEYYASTNLPDNS